MVDGASLDKHHLIPRSKKGKAAELCHKVCHRKIHSIFTDNQLRDYYHTWDRLRENEEIQKFIAWVRKQFARNPEYVDVHRETGQKKRKRKR